jgi:hypothetical protein
LLLQQKVLIEPRRTLDGLGRVVHQNVQARLLGQKSFREALHRWDIAQVQSVNAKPIPPLARVFLGLETTGGRTGKSGHHQHRGAIAQKAKHQLVTDLDPSSGDHGHTAPQVGPQTSHGVVKTGALGAKEVIEEVHLGIRSLANVAALGLVQNP